MSTYKVKEIYYTIQGEGHHTGRPAVFLRFTGCNLWSGREEDRSKAICDFCDTDFIGVDGPLGGTYSAEELAKTARTLWPTDDTQPYIVCTGGEPLLQLDEALCEALHQANFIIAIETNGTLLPPNGVDWICVSPKSNAPIKLTHGDELKLVYPQPSIRPESVEDFSFKYFYLQPMDGDRLAANTLLTIQYCLKHPKWHLSIQTHKAVNIS